MCCQVLGCKMTGMQEGESQSQGSSVPGVLVFFSLWAQRKKSLNFQGKVKGQEICLHRSRVRSGVTPVTPLKDKTSPKLGPPLLPQGCGPLEIMLPTHQRRRGSSFKARLSRVFPMERSQLHTNTKDWSPDVCHLNVNSNSNPKQETPGSLHTSDPGIQDQRHQPQGPAKAHVLNTARQRTQKGESHE